MAAVEKKRPSISSRQDFSLTLPANDGYTCPTSPNQAGIMRNSNDFWYRTLFKLKLYEAAGDSFQRLFNQLMEHSALGFQSIAPRGNWGDGGNDGWIESEGHYFQVYGPKPTTEISPIVVLEKATEDFKKLPQKWKDVRAYSFVINDRLTGAPAPLASTLQQLKSDYSLQEAKVMDSAELMRRFMALPESLRQDILGSVPSEIADFVDPRAVGEVLTHIADSAEMLPAFLDEQAPDFDVKIQLNQITSPVSEYLRTFSWQANTVDEFLGTRGSGLQQSVAGEIHDLYKRSTTVIPDADSDAPNLRYVWMVEELIPSSMRRNTHSMKAYREAAQVVLAKYFETCDAYVHPNNFAAS